MRKTNLHHKHQSSQLFTQDKSRQRCLDHKTTFRGSQHLAPQQDGDRPRLYASPLMILGAADDPSNVQMAQASLFDCHPIEEFELTTVYESYFNLTKH